MEKHFTQICDPLCNIIVMTTPEYLLLFVATMVVTWIAYRTGQRR